MTQNQINYWIYKESQRSNKAKEKETNRSNVARETETNRSNLATERETQRHNLATEVETVRSNVSREVETNRHNVATEMLDKSRIEEQSRQNRAQMTLGYAQHYENVRHNLATEQNAKNTTMLGFANLALGYENARIAADRNVETMRHNQSLETINLMDLAEKRSENLRRNELSYAQLNETSRHNLATEQAENNRNTQATRNWVLENNKLLETSRHNQEVELETKRHNRRNEMNDFINTMGNSIQRLSATGANILKGGLRF